MFYILDDNKNVIPGNFMNYDDDIMRRVAFDDIGPYQVSTVFLFIDHAFGRGRKPVVFETMGFHDVSDVIKNDYKLFDRYSLYNEAVEGHKMICDEVRRMHWRVSNGRMV